MAHLGRSKTPGVAGCDRLMAGWRDGGVELRQDAVAQKLRNSMER
jgi:hypothetical protein